MKKALITGITGQDGSYLTELLLEKGYEVHGIIRRSSSFNTGRIDHIFNDEKYKNQFFFHHGDVTDTSNLNRILEKTEPDEIYHLAAHHGSSEEKIESELILFEKSYKTNILSTINLLEGIRKNSPSTKMFLASSSQVFGIPDEPIQNELSSYKPINIYGITKQVATGLCHYYRNNYNIFASVGILYNHESPSRRSNFISKKIVETAVAIKNNTKSQLIVGSLDSEIDWGYAPDFVCAMHKILQLNEADDFIISTNVKHTVKDFVELVFDYLGLDWKKYVVVNEKIIQRKYQLSSLGDNKKLVSKTGWHPKTDFKQMVKILLDAEIGQST